jgi:hypothetical protein
MRIYPLPKQDRETLMQETRESRLILWELLRLRYPRRQLLDKPIPVDEIREELRQALKTFHGRNQKTIFKAWQRLRLWPPPEILRDSPDQVLEPFDRSDV